MNTCDFLHTCPLPIGADAAVCTAVALLEACYSTGNLDAGQGPELAQAWSTDSCPPAMVTKQSVRQRLALVSSCYPAACPTRGMLKQVYNFFEERRRSGSARGGSEDEC